MYDHTHPFVHSIWLSTNDKNTIRHQRQQQQQQQRTFFLHHSTKKKNRTEHLETNANR